MLLCVTSRCGPLVQVLGCSERGGGSGAAVCCLSDTGKVCVWDLRGRRPLARCDVPVAMFCAGCRTAEVVCGAAQCPYSAQHVVVTASDFRTAFTVALLDVVAGACLSYTTHTFAQPPPWPSQQQQQQQQEQQSSSSSDTVLVLEDGSTIPLPPPPPPPRRLPLFVASPGEDDDDDDGGFGRFVQGFDVESALNRRSPVVCPEAWQCAARHAVTAVVHAPDGLQCVTLPTAPPSNARSRAVAWDRVVAAPVPSLPHIDTFALHPRAPLGTTFLCARDAELFHVVPGAECTECAE